MHHFIELHNYFYIEDMVSAKTMFDEIIEYYKKVTYDCEIKSIIEGEQIKIEFFSMVALSI